MKKSWREIAGDSSIEIWITEGEKKSVRGCIAGVPTIGLGGVYSWLHKSHSTSNDEELPKRSNKSKLIGDFTDFQWIGRKVVVVFDSPDVVVNPNVREARVRLCAALVKLGAKPEVIDLPAPAEGKAGLDDYLQEQKDDAAAIAYLRSLAKPVDRDFAALAKLNEKFAVIEEPLGVYDLEFHSFRKKDEFVTVQLGDRQITSYTEKGVVKEPLGAVWLRWESRRKYRRLTYAPSGPPVTDDGELNLWVDTRPTAEKGDVSPFYELLDHHGITGRVRKQLLQWCAYPVKNPGAKISWAVVMWGLPGTGKSLLANLMAACYGPPDSPNLSFLGSNAELHSGFNKPLLNKQFIVADEVMSSDRRREADFLKSLITSPNIQARVMYKDFYPLPNRANFFFTSNHANAIYLEAGERRYLVLESARDKLETKPELLRALHRWYGEGLGLAGSHLRWHFEHDVDLKGFDPYRAPIETDAAREMMEATYTDVDVALERLRDNRDLAGLGHGTPPPTLLTLEQIMHVVQLQVGDGGRVTNSQLIVSNHRVGTFTKLPQRVRLRAGDSYKESRPRLWCWASDAPKLEPLSPEKLAKIYASERGMPKDKQPEKY